MRDLDSRRKIFSWLSADRDILMILRTDGKKPSLHKVDLETAECRHLINFGRDGYPVRGRERRPIHRASPGRRKREKDALR